MRLKEGGGGGPQTSRNNFVTFTFRVKFYTNWGENVVVCGKSRAMGAYDPTKGAWMSCEHVPKKKKKKKTRRYRRRDTEEEMEEVFGPGRRTRW